MKENCFLLNTSPNELRYFNKCSWIGNPSFKSDKDQNPLRRIWIYL